MTAAQHRHDGWSPDRTVRFLDILSHRGNVARAAAAIGLSRETAYKRRRRDPLFARGWAAAMVLAREEGGHILADRALDGMEEQVWFRGEVVGTRIRYDNRLLLAHIARLDRMALDERAQADAGRFDELVARCATGAGDLPPDRASTIEQAAQAAMDRQEEEAAGGFGEDQWERERREAAERIDHARTIAAATWDRQEQDACAQVDALLQTVSDLSTSHPILSGTKAETAAANGGEGAPATSPGLADADVSTVSIVSTSPACTRPAILRQAQDERVSSENQGPLVPSLSQDAITTPANRAERRRAGRKARPPVPHTRSGRHPHPPLQAHA